MATTEEIIYTAGLFDGEGSIVIGCSKPIKKDGTPRLNSDGTIKVSPSYWLQVGVTNTDYKLLGWLKGLYGGHISTSTHQSEGRSRDKYNRRKCGHWRVMSQEGAFFLRMLYPYLRVKADQALVAIEFAEMMKAHPMGKKLQSEDVQLRESYKVKLQKLKKVV